MGQYDEVVERQRRMLEAEKWAKGVKSIHCLSLTSLWYETKPRRTGDDLSVMDIHHNDGVIEREYTNTGKKETIGTRLTRQDLLDEFDRNSR